MEFYHHINLYKLIKKNFENSNNSSKGRLRKDNLRFHLGPFPMSLNEP